MKWFKFLQISLIAVATLALVACGGSGGSSNRGAGPGDPGDPSDPGVPVVDPTPVTNTTFTPTTLGQLGTGTFSAAVAINHDGMIIGYADDGTSNKGVRWDGREVTPVALPLMPLPLAADPTANNDYSAAYGINATGIAVGESSDRVVDPETTAITENIVAVYWNATTNVFALPQGTFSGSTAYAMNSAASLTVVDGEIVGEAATATGTVAVYWAGTTATPVALNNLPTGTDGSSAAYFINETGVIVGESWNGSQMQAVVWVPTAQGTYGNPVAMNIIPNQSESVAFGINLDGQIVGEAEAAGVVTGVIWDTSGAVVDTLPAATSAQAINNEDRLVGYSVAPTNSATVWNRTSLTDSNVLAEPVSMALGINDSNEIVGINGNSAIVYIPQP